MATKRRRVDYTFAWIKPAEVDFDALAPKPPPVYREWHLVSHDNEERRHIWAHEDEDGWHGWPMHDGGPNKTMLFTTYPKPGWKVDGNHGA